MVENRPNLPASDSAMAVALSGQNLTTPTSAKPSQPVVEVIPGPVETDPEAVGHADFEAQAVGQRVVGQLYGYLGTCHL